MPAAGADWRRYAAPAAFLLAVTIAVVLVRSALRQDASIPTVSTPTAISTAARPTKRFWTVRAGDTFGTISQKTGVPVATIEQLNPNASSTSLFIGEKIKLR